MKRIAWFLALSCLAATTFAAPPTPVQSPTQKPTQAPVQAPTQSPVQKGTTAMAESGYRTYSYQPTTSSYYAPQGNMGYRSSRGMGSFGSTYHSAGWKITGR
ncbi:MAG: hypothetical protein SFU86_22800 [Pirellulaceae bacterium]|nr:hypothetical protein [Pirellulaceae bacterium]